MQFVACMYCHGDLYFLKPTSRHLTSYYLSMAGGGALGGFFTTLLAPILFATVREFFLGYLACGLFVGLAMLIDPLSPLNGRRRIIWRMAAVHIVTGLSAGILVREKN